MVMKNTKPTTARAHRAVHPFRWPPSSAASRAGTATASGCLPNGGAKGRQAITRRAANSIRREYGEFGGYDRFARLTTRHSVVRRSASKQERRLHNGGPYPASSAGNVSRRLLAATG
jgi:hypothetical protein